MTHGPTAHGSARPAAPLPDTSRLHRHVEFLATEPRSRLRTPRGMERAETYVHDQLTAAGWLVERRPFDGRWQMGSTDRHSHRALALKPRLHRRLRGANPWPCWSAPVWTASAAVRAPTTTPPAWRSSWRRHGCWPRSPVPARVVLAVFGMEEPGLIGARQTARELGRDGGVRGMICLESVGSFADAPGTQKLPVGFERVFPEGAAAVRAGGHRGDFALVVHRRSSTAAGRTWQRAAAVASPSFPALLLRDHGLKAFSDCSSGWPCHPRTIWGAVTSPRSGTVGCPR